MGIAVNLVTYLGDAMHLPSAESANIVTDFMGTSFLLCLLGGFLADSFLGRYRTIVIFALIQTLVSIERNLHTRGLIQDQSATDSKDAHFLCLNPDIVSIFLVADDRARELRCYRCRRRSRPYGRRHARPACARGPTGCRWGSSTSRCTPSRWAPAG